MTIAPMTTIYEACLPYINASTTLEERVEVCLGLRMLDWTKEQAEAATGLECGLMKIELS
jgi:hypothetical protein